MCEKELLVSYLYDDLGDGDRARFETHLRGCAECREELSALRGVRADLVSWAPAQPDFGFRVVREPKLAPPPPVSWRAWWTPAAGLAAAAVLVLAAAAALAHVEIRRGPDGLTVRTGWATAAPVNAATTSGAAEASQDARASRPAAAAAVDPAALTRLESRLAALETASRDVAPVRSASLTSAMSARASDAEILRRVRELLAQSETKQQDQLALRIAQVLRDVDAQRVADLNRIQQGFRGLEASVTAEAQGHRELTNYILTSAKQK